MKKYDACIVGYYGMKNSGDDALLSATVWAAENYLGSKQVTVTTPEPLKISGYGNIASTLESSQRYRGQNRLRRYVQAARSRRIIFGGGSVFHTAQDINIKRHMMRLAGGGRDLAVGVGLGPFADTLAERACQKFLQECSFIGLRDRESFEIAQQLAPNANIELTFDLAPLLLCNEHTELIPLPREGVAVCLCPKERLTGNAEIDRKRIASLAKTLADVHANTGEEIYLINLNGHPTLGDQQVHHELQQQLAPGVPVSIIDYDPNPFRVMQRLAAFKVVLSMRLHGSILAFMANTPVLSLNYHSKCEGWCDQVGMPPELRFDASDLDPGEISNALVRGLKNGFKQNCLNAAEAVIAAQKNWRYHYAGL